MSVCAGREAESFCVDPDELEPRVWRFCMFPSDSSRPWVPCSACHMMRAQERTPEEEQASIESYRRFLEQRNITCAQPRSRTDATLALALGDCSGKPASFPVCRG